MVQCKNGFSTKAKQEKSDVSKPAFRRPRVAMEKMAQDRRRFDGRDLIWTYK